MNCIWQKPRNFGMVTVNELIKFIKLLPIKEKPEYTTDDGCEEKEKLLENINLAKDSWLSANNNFEFVCDHEIVDYYTYKIKAYEIKYDYLLKKAKEKGIKVNIGNPKMLENSNKGIV